MRQWTVFAGILGTGLLCACASPAYQPASTGQTARVHFVQMGKPEICVEGQRFALALDDSGNASLPAGQTVHLLARFQQGYVRCDLAVQFSPRAGQSYEVVNDIRAERCIVEVMRHDAAAQYGLRVEPSGNAPFVCVPTAH